MTGPEFVTFLMIFCVVVVIPGVFVIKYVYELVSAHNQVQASLAKIDAALKQRHDMLPNLIAAVKGYMAHELQLITEVTRLRSEIDSYHWGFSEELRLKCEQNATDLYNAVTIVIESNPEISSNTNFLKLQLTLQTLEDQIYSARRRYIILINAFNNMVSTFPTLVIAHIMGYKPIPQYQIKSEEKQAILFAKKYEE